MSMLPIQIGLELEEAMQDNEITPAETTNMMSTIFNSAIGGIMVAFGMVMFNKVLKENPGNPGNPGNPSDLSSVTSDIISRAGLKEYEYKWFPEPEEPSKARVYPYARARHIGAYTIRMTRTDDTCAIKLYEHLPGWKTKLRATWTGMGKVECEKKFEEVVETVIQVRFEHKTVLMR